MSRKKRPAPPPSVDELINPEPGRLEAIWHGVRVPFLWTFVAFGALALVVFVGTTRRGEERLAALPQAVGALVGHAGSPVPPEVVAVISQEVDPLRDAARRTAEERARIEARLADLERNLNDVTGSIRRTTPGEVTGSIDRAPPQAAPNLALPPAPPSEPAPQPPMAATPMPPMPVPRPSEASPSGTITLATRTQFGIDLGSEPTLSALKARWLRLAERHQALIGMLEPVISVREGANGQPTLYLVAGPLADVSDAAALCARLRAAGASTCQPASYDGQRLAIR